MRLAALEGVHMFKSGKTHIVVMLLTMLPVAAAAPFDAMVVAQGLGDADCQAPRHEKSDCRAGPPLGRDHAPHLG
jgi:hypothetical protein